MSKLAVVPVQIAPYRTQNPVTFPPLILTTVQPALDGGEGETVTNHDLSRLANRIGILCLSYPEGNILPQTAKIDVFVKTSGGGDLLIGSITTQNPWLEINAAWDSLIFDKPLSDIPYGADLHGYPNPDNQQSN